MARPQAIRGLTTHTKARTITTTHTVMNRMSRMMRRKGPTQSREYAFEDQESL